MCNLGEIHKGWYIFLDLGVFLAPFLRRILLQRLQMSRCAVPEIFIKKL